MEMEWRCALETRGIDYIHPVALADPRAVAPPEPLRAKHFGGLRFAIREHEKRLAAEGLQQSEPDPGN